jgi:hypothetical protein
MLTVKLSIDDGKGKKANLEITEANDLNKLIIIQNVFNLFGVGTDVMEMTNDYRKFGAGYSKFFNQVDPIEPNKDNLKTIDIEQQLTESYENNKDELESTYKETNDDNVPEYVRTGIKIKDETTKLYRCRYECYACYFKGSMYIYPNSKSIRCIKCSHILEVNSAHPDGFPNQDSFNNFFRAGDFKDKYLF